MDRDSSINLNVNHNNIAYIYSSYIIKKKYRYQRYISIVHKQKQHIHYDPYIIRIEIWSMFNQVISMLQIFWIKYSTYFPSFLLKSVVGIHQAYETIHKNSLKKNLSMKFQGCLHTWMSHWIFLFSQSSGASLLEKVLFHHQNKLPLVI